MVNYHAVRLSRETLDSKRRDTPMLLRFLMGVARKFRILAMVKRPSNTNATEERTPSSTAVFIPDWKFQGDRLNPSRRTLYE